MIDGSVVTPVTLDHAPFVGVDSAVHVKVSTTGSTGVVVSERA